MTRKAQRLGALAALFLGLPALTYGVARPPAVELWAAPPPAAFQPTIETPPVLGVTKTRPEAPLAAERQQHNRPAARAPGSRRPDHRHHRSVASERKHRDAAERLQTRALNRAQLVEEPAP